MYFNNQIKFDPSSKTDIVAIPPTKAFKKMLNFLSAGSLSKKEEHETYCAISILQQLNLAMRKVGINNIVRLTKDDIDFYVDHEGKQDDLKEALDSFELKVDQVESGVFNMLELVLEHEDENFVYLIDVKISRIHPVGEFPIEIHVNGLLKDFKADGGDAAKLKEKLENELFKNQDEYHMYMKHKRGHFDAFTTRIQWEFKTLLKCDDVKQESKQKLLRPKKGYEAKQGVQHNRDADAVYHGYHGFDDYFLYAWLWSDLMHSYNYACHDCTIVSDAGEALMEVGGDGFLAGESDILDLDTDLSMDESLADIGGDMEDSSGFFDSVFESAGDLVDGAGDLFGGGDSSCSSCSSCGGGCGGD